LFSFTLYHLWLLCPQVTKVSSTAPVPWHKLRKHQLAPSTHDFRQIERNMQNKADTERSKPWREGETKYVNHKKDSGYYDWAWNFTSWQQNPSLFRLKMTLYSQCVQGGEKMNFLSFTLTWILP
jgi:hypothetical protein